MNAWVRFNNQLLNLATGAKVKIEPKKVWLHPDTSLVDWDLSSWFVVYSIPGRNSDEYLLVGRPKEEAQALLDDLAELVKAVEIGNANDA